MRILSSRLPRKVAAIFAAFTVVSASPFGLFSAADAHAQDAAPPKKKKKPKPEAETPPPAPPVEEAAPAAAPPASVDATATAPADTKPVDAKPVAEDDWDIKDVTEKPGKTYYFVGLRYRGTIIPKAFLNLFVEEGKTIYSSSVAAEIDIRKDGFSLIPAIGFTEYGTAGDMLFRQKNTNADDAFNYSVVNSSLKALQFTADILWSAKLSKTVDFEYGAGFGLGVIFGNLSNNWVYEDPKGSLTGANGRNYSACQTEADHSGALSSGCSNLTHTTHNPVKVGGYTEPSWVNGGSKPNIFPHIALPELGLRIKPIKQLETRVMVGFSLTGFFFGINGAYGLEKRTTEAPSEPSSVK